MDHFNFRDGVLHAEEVPLPGIAEEVGTPCYVYSRATIERHWRAFDAAFDNYPHQICYSVKANSNLALINVLARLGSGFDIVSGGELERVLRAGGATAKIVFSGVGKAVWEIRRALQARVYSINVESEAELERVNAVAKSMRCVAPVALRVNPDVDAKTHPYIATGLEKTKFGIPIQAARDGYRRALTMHHLQVVGVACHIGSQLTHTEPYVDALRRILDLVDELGAQGIALEHLSLGGGLGIRYRDERPPLPAEFARAILAELVHRSQRIPIIIEPGRAIVGNAGVLLSRVEYLKRGPRNRFAVIDAAMNDLIRPALYDAWQDIVAVHQGADAQARTYDVVGPVCESADVLGRNRSLDIAPGDLVAIRSAGAYAAVMCSNYNSRPRPAEVMVDGSGFHVVRRRESLEDLFALESLLPD